MCSGAEGRLGGQHRGIKVGTGWLEGRGVIRGLAAHGRKIGFILSAMGTHWKAGSAQM